MNRAALAKPPRRPVAPAPVKVQPAASTAESPTGKTLPPGLEPIAAAALEALKLRSMPTSQRHLAVAVRQVWPWTPDGLRCPGYGWPQAKAYGWLNSQLSQGVSR